MVYQLWNILYLVQLFILGVLFLLILNKQRKEKNVLKKLDKGEEIESLANPILITIILFASLIYTAFFSTFSPIIPFPLDVITIAWYGLFLLAF